jgi:TolB protein
MESGDTSDIYVVNADGSGMVRLVGDAAWDTDPAWSPDGTSIAFCSIRGQDDLHPIDRAFGVYRISAVVGAEFVELAALGCDPAWSPDGSRIAFSTWSSSFGPVLSVISGGGAPIHELRTGQAFAQRGPANPSWSPDGTQIVFEQSIGLSVVGYGGAGFGAVAPFLSGRSPSWR